MPLSRPGRIHFPAPEIVVPPKPCPLAIHGSGRDDHEPPRPPAAALTVRCSLPNRHVPVDTCSVPASTFLCTPDGARIIAFGPTDIKVYDTASGQQVGARLGRGVGGTNWMQPLLRFQNPDLGEAGVGEGRRAQLRVGGGTAGKPGAGYGQRGSPAPPTAAQRGWRCRLASITLMAPRTLQPSLAAPE